MIWREGGPSSNRGLTFFVGFTYADPSTAIIQYFWEAGLVKQDTFAGWDNDSIAFAVSQSLVSNSLVNAQNQANITNRLACSPMKWIWSSTIVPRSRPGSRSCPTCNSWCGRAGWTSPPSAFVLGLQVAVAF